MSERMIELQRAKMLQQSGGRGAMPGHSPVAASQGRNVPQQTAVSTMQTEDQQMQRFFSRMQRRDDSQQLVSDSTSGPTVPTALSRRMLHRQGVGYLDDTVAAIASASADRFLATVLHQAVACRDQRLKGIEMAKESKRHRKRHLEQYQADTDDRRRRKQEHEQQREKSNLAAIAAADAIKKGGSAKKDAAADGAKTKKTKKKKDAADDKAIANGNKKVAALKHQNEQDEDDDDESYDSLDEEEELYQNYYDDEGDSDDSDDEEDETLRLTDILRPLEAWDFHIAGKLGFDAKKAQSEDEDSDEDNEDEDQPEENGEEDGDVNMKDANAEKDDDRLPDDVAGASSTPKKASKSAVNTATPNQS